MIINVLYLQFRRALSSENITFAQEIVENDKKYKFRRRHIVVNGF